VRGTEGEGAAEAGGGDPNYSDGENATVASTSLPTPGGAASGDSVWHLVIDREQVGPMTAAEVRAKVAAG
jgi:hypothetical protein